MSKNDKFVVEKHNCTECPHFMGITCDDCIMDNIEDEIEAENFRDHELYKYFGSI